MYNFVILINKNYISEIVFTINCISDIYKEISKKYKDIKIILISDLYNIKKFPLNGYTTIDIDTLSCQYDIKKFFSYYDINNKNTTLLDIDDINNRTISNKLIINMFINKSINKESIRIE